MQRKQGCKPLFVRWKEYWVNNPEIFIEDRLPFNVRTKDEPLLHVDDHQTIVQTLRIAFANKTTLACGGNDMARGTICPDHITQAEIRGIVYLDHIDRVRKCLRIIKGSST